MRLHVRVRKLLFWGMLLVLSSLAGGLGFAYTYYTDSATLRTLIKAKAARYLPQAQLDLRTVRVRVFWGDVKLTEVAIRQVVDGANFQALRIPRLLIKHESRALLKGRFEPRELILAQPTLRLCRRKDGTWNLHGLLADPWPTPPVKETPPIVIQNGTIELVERLGPGKDPSIAVLREASINVESVEGNARRLKFEGTAKGEVFDRVSLSGTIDLDTGQISLGGDLTRLVLSDKLVERLPPSGRALATKLGLSAGELDLAFRQVVYDLHTGAKLSYEATGRLRAGVWSCEKLPFPINDLTARFALRNGVLTINQADGSNGSTTVRAHGTVALQDVPKPALDLHVEVNELELDERLRKALPAQLVATWEDFQPRGRVNLAVDVNRPGQGQPLTVQTHAVCLDVGMLYRYFKYPLDHVRGRVDWTGSRVTMNLGTLIGGKELRARGTIENPGPKAVVTLNFEGESLPIDKTLLDAIPPDIRKVINDFQPSGSVRGSARFERKPPLSPRDDPKGRIAIHASLDLNERCAIRWVGLPYPVENLTGHLELHPNQWAFKDMRGGNGTAVITGFGEVRKVGEDAAGKDRLKVDLHLRAEHLPFDRELQESLPPAWQMTWPVLNPIGSSDVNADILVEPNKPDHYHIVIVPRPATSVRLNFQRARRSATDPGGLVEMRMEDVRGRFVFDNGEVQMQDVAFQFRESPVRLSAGTVRVHDNGSFQLAVNDLWVQKFRIDQGLRDKMPPLMDQFARRLDLQTFEFKGNLWLSWSGSPEQPVRCSWNKVQVVLDDNAVQAGLPLEHIQGTLNNLEGFSDGEKLELKGLGNLDSVYLLGQQVTQVTAGFEIDKEGQARITNVEGKLLGGELKGKVEISLDTTPKYAVDLELRDADLGEYTKTLPGRQRFRGRVGAKIHFNGLGSDLHTLEGGGEAHVSGGDLGQLPSVLTVMKLLTLTPITKSAFDSADVEFTIRDGETYFDPIKFTGDAVSLRGRGKLDVQGALDLRLHVSFSRDRVYIPGLTDMLREAGAQFLVVRVLGTPASPKFSLEPLPAAKAMAERRAARLDAGEFQGTRRRFFLPFRP